MKTVFAALVGAVGTTLACWRLILILWFVVASLAWLFVTPVRTGVTETYAHSPMAAGLLQTFDTESFVDFWWSERDPVGETRTLMEAGLFGWVILWTILSAGVLVRVADKQRFDGFLSCCARYAHRFIWLLAITLLAFWALAWVNDQLSRLVTSLIQGDDNGSGAGFLGWTMTVKTLIVLALLGVIVTAARFARLRVVLLDERLVVRSWLRAFASVVRHLPSIGLGRVLSLWPVVVAFVLYRWGTAAVLSGWELIPGLRLEWRLVLVMQLSQLLLIAALVYRMAVDARLWVIVAPRVAYGSPAPIPEPGEEEAPGEAAAPADAPSTDAPPRTAAEAPSALPSDEVSLSVSRPEDGSPRSSGEAPKGFLALFLSLGLAAAAHTQEAAEPPTQRAGAAPAATAQDAPEQTPDEAAAVAAPASRRSARSNAYVMDVTVDIAGRTVGGTVQATFTNLASEAVDVLWMHLYAAAFSNTHTHWIQGGREDAIRERGEALGGYLDVRSVSLPTGEDLSGSTEIDDTLMKVTLGQPVPPGGSVELVIGFETRFPDVIARMGQIGNHIDGMQWFPKFCAHGEDGWSNRPFHRIGEFFANFGSYDVTFRYPAAIDGDPVILEATGVPGPEQPDGEGWLKRRFTAQDVIDFAFCADTSFVRYEATYEEAGTGRTVDIVYLCQPYAEPKAEQVLSAMQAYLAAAGERWMPYPYERVVIDGLPHSQGGGMEYPMLFTISQRFPNHLPWLVELTEDPASVLAHEFAHQYWYGVLASDEVAAPWLDEGFTAWATNELVEARWPDAGQTDFRTFLDRKLVRDALNGGLRGELPFTSSDLSLQGVIGWSTSPFHDTPPDKPTKRPTLLGYRVPDVKDLRLPDMSADRPAWWKTSYREVAGERPLEAPARDFTTGYGGLVYRKTALMLATLERHVGQDTMADIIKTYVQRFAFRHPTGDDFRQVVRELTDGRYDELLRQLIETTGTVDWTVQDVTTARIEGLEGFSAQRRPGDPVSWQAPDDEPESSGESDRPMLQGLWRALFTTPYPDGTAGAEAAPAGVEAETETSGEWLSRYVVRQLGEIVAPVEVEARFADGSVIRNTWDGVDGYELYEHRTPSKLVSVVVDPERLFPIDLDVNNNGYVLQANHETTRALTAYSQFWAQNVLCGWALIF